MTHADAHAPNEISGGSRPLSTTAGEKRECAAARRGPRATPLLIERQFSPDRDAALAALRVVLRLPAGPVAQLAQRPCLCLRQDQPPLEVT